MNHAERNMPKRLWIAPYELHPRTRLSSLASSAPRRGSLLKAEFESGIGYADLHPWPELGDEPLETQLRLLREAQCTLLSARSLEIAYEDSAARSRGESLLAVASGLLEVPQSHSLISDLATLQEAELIDIKHRGFKSIKLKLGREPKAEARVLTQLAPVLSSFRLRFDFNSSWSRAFTESKEAVRQMAAWFRSLPQEVIEAVEFIEDPLVWDLATWSELSRQLDSSQSLLALDRVSPAELSTIDHDSTFANANRTAPFASLVVKPAVQDPVSFVRLATRVQTRLCFTSYLDHPLGQASAACVAAKAMATAPELVGTCGLLSQSAYLPSSYSELLGEGPDWKVQDEPGLGFGELLEKEKWTAV